VAVAVLTLFVEGSVHERAELNGTRRRGTPDEVVARHPLVLHYGCPPSAMVLARAHAAVEGSHRTSAWRILLTHLSEYGADTEAVVAAMEHALQLWHAYRDGVAEQMGLHRTRHA
jgi:pyrroloquinoline-quinone synthase